MPRLPLLLVLAAATIPATALAESAPPPRICDASTAIPAVSELPSGCPLATFAPVPTPDRPFEQAPPPYVTVFTPNGAPRRAETSISQSWTTMPGHFEYCAPTTCSNEVVDGDVDATRYDVVFLEAPPVGSTLEISGAYGDTRRVRVTAAGPCPAVVAPSVRCELPLCGTPEAHCIRPGPYCDGGVTPYVPDARAPYDDDPRDPDYNHDHHGCSSTGSVAASPLLLVGLALLLRRRRR